ncbi:MAG: hypothetical protein M3R72_07865, partial [Bacteroidota bacterium]|nr:hypothetical protein [Bacteroidota bacterium]
MTFLILYNKTKQNDCARFLMELLIEIWAKQNVAVQHCNSITEAKKLVINKANAAIVIHQTKPSLSFINLLWLRSIIKKNNIQRLVLFNFSKVYTFPVQQLFVVNNVAQWNDKKPLSASVKMAVATNKAKQNLLAHNEVPEENVVVVPFATETGFKPIDWSEKQSVKMQYTQGKEFFMCRAEGKT